MKAINILWAVVLVSVLLGGCGSESQRETGFLSDYSKLEIESKNSMNYANEEALEYYNSFIVDPVEVVFYSGQQEERKLTDDQINNIKGYMNMQVLDAVQGSGKKIVYLPGPGVARLRIALTDLRKTDAVNLLPQAALVGAGIGGAAVEAELVDSMTGDQLGALVESRSGSNIPFANMGDVAAAKSCIDQWTKRLQELLTY